MDDQQNPKPKKPDLSTLYPTAKSYDQIKADHAAIVTANTKKVEHSMRFDALYIAIGLTVTILVLENFIKIIPSAVWANQASGADVSIIFCAIIGVLLYVMVRQVKAHAKIKNSRYGIFFLAYVLNIVPQIYASEIIGKSDQANVHASIYIATTNFVIVLLLLFITYANQLPARRKIVMIMIITIISIVSGVIVANG